MLSYGCEGGVPNKAYDRRDDLFRNISLAFVRKSRNWRSEYSLLGHERARAPDQSALEVRANRLLQIKQELSGMLERPSDPKVWWTEFANPPRQATNPSLAGSFSRALPCLRSRRRAGGNSRLGRTIRPPEIPPHGKESCRGSGYEFQTHSFHVLISLAGIASGLVAMYGFLTNQRLVGWNTVFLTTTVLTINRISVSV